MSLITLAQQIVEHDDSAALEELHANRGCFAHGKQHRLLMSDYLSCLREGRLGRRWCLDNIVLAERAYDLTLAKFLNLPSGDSDFPGNSGSDGPDCRHYYRAFYRHAVRELKEQPAADMVEKELRAAHMLQKTVTRHFHLSCLECCRRAQKWVRRYRWKINGDDLVIWMPVEMSGALCGHWLKEHISDVDPSRPGERDRVQEIADRLLAHRSLLSLDHLQEQGVCISADLNRGSLTLEGEIAAVGLARVVAEEKSEQIDQQRPSIRALGCNKLKRLVMSIFGSLIDGDFHAEQLARSYGLSKATFSRFAGPQWNRDGDGGDGGKRIPDLWLNTATVLARHEGFIAAARTAGVWDRVQQINSKANGREGEVS